MKDRLLNFKTESCLLVSRLLDSTWLWRKSPTSLRSQNRETENSRGDLILLTENTIFFKVNQVDLLTSFRNFWRKFPKSRLRTCDFNNQVNTCRKQKASYDFQMIKLQDSQISSAWKCKLQIDWKVTSKNINTKEAEPTFCKGSFSSINKQLLKTTVLKKDSRKPKTRQWF